MIEKRSRYHGVRWNGHSWQARWRDERGIQIALAGFDSERDAHDFRVAKLDQVRIQRLRQKHLPFYDDGTLGEVTIAELHERWRRRRRQISEATDERYLSYWRNHLEPEFGDLAVKSVTVALVEDWQAGLLESGLHDDTVRSARGVLRRIIDIGRKDGAVPSNVVIDAEPVASAPHLGLETRRVLSSSEARILVDAMTQVAPAYTALLQVGFGTGLRPAEVFGLRVEDLRLDDYGMGWISVQRQVVVVKGRARLSTRLKGEPGTSASRRTIPIDARLLDVIHQHMARFGVGPAGLLFQAPSGGVIDPNNFRGEGRALGRAVRVSGLDVVGLPPVVPYTWRHSHGTWLLAAGVPPAEAAKRLGHTRQGTLLDWYSHPLPGGAMAAVKALAASDVDNLWTVPDATVVSMDLQRRKARS